jgi:DNA-binding MarR family transcriptional regulator
MRKTDCPLTLDLDRYVPALLVWVSNKLSASASQLYRGLFDLGVTDWRVLAYIHIYPWSTGAQVCALIGLDKAAVSRSFGFLEGRGLLRSRHSGLRKVEYTTTAEGARLYQKVLKLAMARERALLTGYSPGERTALIQSLHRLLNNLAAVDAVSEAQPNGTSSKSLRRAAVFSG